MIFDPDPGWGEMVVAILIVIGLCIIFRDKRGGFK
jgi:hypothetical protein